MCPPAPLTIPLHRWDSWSQPRSRIHLHRLPDKSSSMGARFGAHGAPMAVVVDHKDRIASQVLAGGPERRELSFPISVDSSRSRRRAATVASRAAPECTAAPDFERGAARQALELGPSETPRWSRPIALRTNKARSAHPPSEHVGSSAASETAPTSRTLRDRSALPIPSAHARKDLSFGLWNHIPGRPVGAWSQSWL